MTDQLMLLRIWGAATSVVRRTTLIIFATSFFAVGIISCSIPDRAADSERSDIMQNG
jgi:hypothetical protein